MLTWSPAAISLVAVSGTRATRRSAAAVSLGIATFTPTECNGMRNGQAAGTRRVNFLIRHPIHDRSHNQRPHNPGSHRQWIRKPDGKPGAHPGDFQDGNPGGAQERVPL